MKPIIAFVFLVSATLFACGPSVSNGNGDDTGSGDDSSGGPDARSSGPCTISGTEGDPASCSDGIDNDCDGRFDCSDPDCSGIGSCPVCGEVDTSAGTGIMLPDGVDGTSCSTDADCGGTTPNCVEQTCHASYVSTLNVIGFGANQTFDNVGLVKSVCLNIEHSYLRDMEITLKAPGGQKVRLSQFEGQQGGEVYLGQANDCDEAPATPTPGVGATYCITPTATQAPMIDSANNGDLQSVSDCHGSTSEQLVPGDFQASDPWTQLDGTPLNGQWSIVVTDLWPADNGFIFNWTINFDPNSVTDCSGPIVN